MVGSAGLRADCDKYQHHRHNDHRASDDAFGGLSRADLRQTGRQTEMIRTPKNVLIDRTTATHQTGAAMTTAAITCNSSPEPAFGSAASSLEI
jgi:hypothetical protein